MQKKRGKVLIVEDEAVISFTLEYTLKKSGYEVVGIFAQGEQCLQYLESNEAPDVVLMDIQLEGKLDGIETAAMIREKWYCPVVYLTAFSSPELIERAKLSSPFGYLVKPIAEKDLQTTIEISIYRAELENQLRVSERRFKGLASSLQQIVFQTDARGCITYMNNLGQQQLGITSDDYGRASLLDICFPHGDNFGIATVTDPDQFQNCFREAVRISGVSGRPQFYEVQVSPEYANGKLSGYFGLMVNATKARLQLEIQKAIGDLTTMLGQGKIGTDEFINYLLKLVYSLTAADFVYCNIYDESNNTIATHSPLSKSVSVRSNGGGLSEFVVGSGTPLFLSGKALDLFQEENNLTIYGQRAKSWMGVPIFEGTTVFGVLTLLSYSSEDYFQQSDFEVINDLGRELSFVLQSTYLTRLAEEKEVRYKNLVNSINEGILQVNLLDETIMFANARFSELLGLDPGTQLVGRKLKELYQSQPDSEMFPKILELRRNGEESVYEPRIITPKGEEKWFRVSGKSFIGKSGKYDTALSVWTDISKSKLAEKSIRESEARLREVVTTIEEAFWLTESHTQRILYYSPSFVKVFGLLPQGVDSISKFRKAILVPEDESVFKSLERDDGIECPYDIEYRIIDQSGNIKWIQERTFPVYDENGSIIKIAGTSIDISDRKEAESLLLQSEQKLRATINSIPDSLIVVDSNGIISDCILKSALRKELDSSGDYRGKRFSAILGVEYESMLEKFISGDSADEVKKLEYMGSDSERQIWLEFRMARTNDSRKLVLIRDITNETVRERDLLRFFNIIEQSEEMIVVTDTDGKITYVNPRFTEITGYSPTEVYGLTPAVVNSGKHKRRFFSNLWNAIKAGKSYHGEFVNRKKNGEIYYEEKIISPVFDSQGTMINFIATGRDITEKKNTEQRLEAYKKLQDYHLRKQQRQKALLLFQGQEEERTRLSRDLHDGIGQILTAIKINMESVHFDGAPKKVNERLGLSNELIVEAIQEVRRVSGDLSPSGLHDFGLHSAVKNLVMRMENTLENCAIRLNSQIPDFRFKSSVEIGIYRIIQEALNNAMRHSKATWIEINLFYNDGWIKLSVVDNGIGIAEDVAVDNSFIVSRGKGLNNMKERARIIGGKLNIVSEKNAGVLISFEVKTKAKKNEKSSTN